MAIAKDDFLMTHRIAHRGLHDNKTMPENSLAAFRNAVEHGYGIELDVYLTDDGTLIVHRDPSLKRTCGIKIHPEKIDSSHLEKYRLMNTDEHIPKLSDVLSLVDGRVGLLIEIKVTKKYEQTCAAVWEMLKDYKGHYWIESFDPRTVRWWHEHHPEVILGQLYDIYAWQRAFCRRMRTHDYVDFLAASVMIVKKRFFAKVTAARPEVAFVAWTVRTPSQKRLAETVNDNFIFECDIKNPAYIEMP